MKPNLNVCSLIILTLAWATESLLAQQPTIPPEVTHVSPLGVMRGSTGTLTLEGRNLTGAQAILFEASGLSAKVVGVKELPEPPKPSFSGVGRAELPRGTRQEATIEVAVSEEVEPGLYLFRVLTPLGTSNLKPVVVGTLPEVQESEPNNSLGESQAVELPQTLVGTLGWPGDVDSFSFTAKAEQELVFQPIAGTAGSELQSVLIVRDATGQELGRSGDYSREADSVLIFKAPADGRYILSVTDLMKSGGKNHAYRVNAGLLPYVRSAFPLGVAAGESSEVQVEGTNLGDIQKVTVQVPPTTGWGQTVPLRVKTDGGQSLNEVSLAVGDIPEVIEREANDNVRQAQKIRLPATINGRLFGSGSEGLDSDLFRFAAKTGQRLSMEVMAARLGSPVDTVIEVLDADGRKIPQATVRCVLETTMQFSRDSKSPRTRLSSVDGLRVGDYLLVEDELAQITFLPDQPDADIFLKSYGGERVAHFNTSPQAHAAGRPICKAEILEPGAKFPPNGLPVRRLTYRNDDGGPGYDQDSRLTFVAPEAGEYLVRVTDIRGLGGKEFHYRLTIRGADPDFTLAAKPVNPNVPRGGRTPITVEADRRQGYKGPIELKVKGLPEGVTASSGTIPAGQDSGVIVLSAAANASLPGSPTSLKIVGRGQIDGRQVVRTASAEEPLRLVSLMPPPDLVVAGEPDEIVLEPGQTVSITLRVERKNDFQGRVPCNILNLPPGVSIVNIGLSGVLVREAEDSRTVTLRADEWAPPIEQTVYVIGKVESNAPTVHASTPLKVTVRPKREMASADLGLAPEP